MRQSKNSTHNKPLIMENENVLDISENYSTFGEFYFTNKLLIFKTLLNGYKKLSDNLDLTITIKIKARVEEINFETTFILTKDNDEVIERLMNMYLPYFEENEDYETCDEIKKMYKKIKGV